MSSALLNGSTPIRLTFERTEPLLVFVLTVLGCSFFLGKFPYFDELYHVLAARSFAEEGTLAIADGVYERNAAYTVVIGWLFAMFGESLTLARLPSLLMGAVWVSLVFVWVRQEAGRLAAWLTVGLFVASPFATDAFQLVRFYALQGLLVFSGVLALQSALMRPHGLQGRLLRIIVAAGLLGLAAWIQVITLAILPGLALWALCGLAFTAQTGWVRANRVGLILAGLVAAAACVALAWLFRDRIVLVWEIYRFAPVWIAAEQSNLTFYHTFMLVHYPALWALAPVAALYALARAPELARLSLFIFVPAIIILSLGGMKSTAYIVFLMPFFFALWGVALAGMLASVSSWAAGVTREALHRGFGLDPLARGARLAVRGVLAAALAFTVLSHTGVPLAADNLLKPLYRDPPGWAAAALVLAPEREQGAIVMTMNELNALYFLGQLDYTIGPSRLSEQDDPKRGADRQTPREFMADYRTGRPIVSTPRSVERVISCHPRGLVIADWWGWRHPAYISDAVADVIERHAERLSWADDMRLVVYRWQSPESDAVADGDEHRVLADCPPR